MWTRGDIAFDIIDDMTVDPVVTVLVSTPDGPLEFMAEPEAHGTTLVLHRLHVQSVRQAVGAANLMVLARALLEEMGFDEFVVEGAIRTTGANPGHRPRTLRFSRRVRAAAVGRSPGT